VIDRVSQKIVVMASSEGGMDVEEVAEKTPELIHRFCCSKAGRLRLSRKIPDRPDE
jgi:succinyl-CoA synthetase beta subunit